MTRRLCKKHGKSSLYVDLGKETGPAFTLSYWITEYDIQVLNVAGSRGSKHPGIHDQVMDIIKRVLVGLGHGLATETF